MNNKIGATIKDYLIITFGLLVFTIGWVVFIIPAEITGGGISGVAAVIFYATKIPVSISFLAINIVLVLIAIKILGANFGVKTIFSIAVLTGFFALFQDVVKEPIVDDTFLSAVLGGMSGGIGLGIVFSRGGSTGGTDIFAMIINKYRNVSPGRVIMLADVIIIASSYFVFQSLEKLVYGYVVMWVVSYTLDSFLSGANRSAQMFIVSENFEEIAEFINTEATRGVTLLDGTGWYTKEKTKVLMSVVRKKETGAIFRKIKEIDPDAFISMGSVMGVYGQGFDKIKF
ncbi:MAG: YitT family protein [Prolixibacteraceae bacterium]|nr:YitT family protein [Prolixibacteraceae bacterium]MBT6764361.1 YitT family protein [Prolixibacteraceae bacterium]MBT6998155.1 YitT family protein [Prolixibacteraceae bacterium]MBT7395697.1 YitT family protein [Prolixibacteraceae bacterium]